MKKTTFLVLLVLVVSFYSTMCNPPLFPKKLWVYWHTPIQEAPFLVQLCVEKMRIVCQESNWTLYVLNETNLPQYIPSYYSKFKPARDKAEHPDWFANVADLIRLAVLDENGGLYLDISAILFRGLGWFERLEEYPHLLTNSEIDKGIYPQVLQSYLGYYQSSSQIRDGEKGITNLFPGYESWFIASTPKSAYISALRARHTHHYTHTQQQNRLEDIEKNYYLKFTQSDYLNNQKSAYQILQETQFQLDKNLTLFGKRVNVNKHFKHVGFHAEYGPLAFYVRLAPRQKMFTHTVSQIQQQDYASLQFLVKFTNSDRPFIIDNLNRILEVSKNYPNIRQNFEKFLASKPSYDQCKNLKLIVEDSVFGDLIKNNRIALEKNLTAITVEQRNKWLTYCYQTHNVPTSHQIELDDRIKMIIDEWILYYTGEYLNEEQNKKLREYLVDIGKVYTFATQQTMGAFSDAQEAYYWQKKFEQKMAANGIDVKDKQHPSMGKPLDEYSFWQLLKLRLKLKILSNRAHLAYTFKIDNYFQLFTFVLAWTFLIIIIKMKILFFAGKCLYVTGCVMMVYVRGENRYSIPEVVEQAKQYVRRMVELVKGVKMEQVIKLTSWLVFFLLKKFATFVLSVIFVVYNAIVCYKYYAVVYFGEIYHQQSTFLFYILLQICFRKAFQKIGSDKWGFPGLTLEQMRRIFLPVYIFCIGAAMVAMGEKVQVRNLALSSSVCMILPVLIREAQMQIYKVVQLYNLEQLPNKLPNEHTKKFASIFIKGLVNLSTSIQIAIISFLALNILLPNLRFLVSNNEIYTMTKLMYFLQKLNHFMFWLIIGLYLAEFYQRNKLIRKQNVSLIARKPSYDNLNEIDESNMNENISSVQSKNSFSPKNTEMPNSKVSSSNKPSSIYYQSLNLFLLIIFYSFKLWLFYQMIYLPWQELIIKNTWSIYYQQSLVWLEYQKPFRVVLKMMALFTIFFVSFEIEKLLEDTLLQKNSKPNQSKSSSSKSKQSSYINISQHPEPIPPQNEPNLKIYCLLLAGLTVFLYPRFQIISLVYTELTAVNTKDQTLKYNTEFALYNLMYDSLIFTVYGFKIMKELLIGWKELNCEELRKKVLLWKEQNDGIQFQNIGENVGIEMQKSDHLMTSE